MPEADLTARQLELIAALAALDPPLAELRAAELLLGAREDQVDILVLASDGAGKKRVLRVAAHEPWPTRRPRHVSNYAVKGGVQGSLPT